LEILNPTPNPKTNHFLLLQHLTLTEAFTITYKINYGMTKKFQQQYAKTMVCHSINYTTKI